METFSHSNFQLKANNIREYKVVIQIFNLIFKVFSQDRHYI